MKSLIIVILVYYPTKINFFLALGWLNWEWSYFFHDQRHSFIPVHLGYIHWCQKYIYILEEKEIHCSLSSGKWIGIARLVCLILAALLCILQQNIICVFNSLLRTAGENEGIYWKSLWHGWKTISCLIFCKNIYSKTSKNYAKLFTPCLLLRNRRRVTGGRSGRTS